MTNGVDGPRIIVERNSRAVSRATTQPVSVRPNMTAASWPGKKTPEKRMKTGSLAPQAIKGTVNSVAIFSRGLRRVRAASTPGTAQPPAMPPPTMNGITEQPCSPKIRKIRSSM